MASAASLSTDVLCSARGIEKRYGGVRALAGVDLEIRPGEIHAIVGENGAGKSTLMKILAGVERPDAGAIEISGEATDLIDITLAREAGIAIVFQELNLFGEVDVLANLFGARQLRRGPFVSRRVMRDKARPVLEELGLHADLDQPLKNLAIGEQQLVEIARALLARPVILILDEPNSALNATETVRLFEIVQRLRSAGVAILYISHRLEEVFAIADRITVMRNGSVVAEVAPSSSSIPAVVELMIGRPPDEFVETVSAESGKAALVFESVAARDQLEDVSFTIATGEIIGLAGLDGSGVATCFKLLFGLEQRTGGQITMPDGGSQPRSVTAAVKRGVAYVSGDRRNVGVMLAQSIVENMCQVTAGPLGRFGPVLRRRTLEQRTVDRAGSLRIKMSSPWDSVHSLSGGNQQKVVIGKWLEADPQMVLLDDPTRGVDVASKIELYHTVKALAAGGKVVVFTSSELPEFVHLCDRVLVFYGGRLRGELAGSGLNEHTLLQAVNTGVV